MSDPSSSPPSTKLHQPTSMNHPWPENTCIHDMDDFLTSLTTFTSNDIQPELINSIITHYTTKWLSHFSQNKSSNNISPTSSFLKQKFFIQTLINFLPQKHQTTFPSTFLLKLLKAAKIVAIEQSYLTQIEKKVAFQLDQATINELMIPSFDHNCPTLLDIDLVYRLVQIFAETNAKSSSAFVKVAKLVDSYLVEAAMDAEFTVTQFIGFVSVLPQSARASHDGLYRAVDTFLKVHSRVTKQDRKTLCYIIDIKKLSQEATIHAAQNDRLPVRLLIQILFSEQAKTNHQLERSVSFSGTRSTPMASESVTRRDYSKRVTIMSSNEVEMEMRRLKEQVMKLECRCDLLQMQMERILEKKKNGFKWKRFDLVTYFGNGNVVYDEKVEDRSAGDRKRGEIGTPLVVRGRTRPQWRKSLS